MKKNITILMIIGILVVSGCKNIGSPGNESSNVNTANENNETANTEKPKSKTPGTKLTEDGFVMPETDGTAKEMPEAGKANVQG